MKVSRTKIPVGTSEDRYRTVVETDLCTLNTLQSRVVRHELLRYIADDPSFSQCGGFDFQKAKIYHDGTKWIAEFEAVVQR